MGSLILRGLDEATLARIGQRAVEHEQSVEREAIALLQMAVRSRMSASERVFGADRIAAMTPSGVTQTDSTILIRADRDR